MTGSIRHFTDLSAVSAEQLRAIISDAARRKARLKAGERSRPLEGKVLAMIFDKPSTRTRVSFDVAMRELGGETIMLTGAEMQLGRGETIGDTSQFEAQADWLKNTSEFPGEVPAIDIRGTKFQNVALYLRK